jgi:hypothetical protein
MVPLLQLFFILDSEHWIPDTPTQEFEVPNTLDSETMLNSWFGAIQINYLMGEIH